MIDPSLSASDRDNMAAFVERVLRGHASGVVELTAAAGALMATMDALGDGEVDQARMWFEEGRDLVSHGSALRPPSR
jgi:hypothetical protein